MITTTQKVALVIVLIISIFFLVYREYIPIPDALKKIIPTQSTNQQTTATPTPVFVTTPTPDILTAPTGDAGAVFNTINARRSEAGAPVLVNQGVLQSLAATHAADMAAREYFSHVTPDGMSFQDRLSASAYGSQTAAENIGVVTEDPTDAVGLWMDSTEHRTFMLSTAYQAMGVGVAAGTYQGQPAYYVVVVFGDIQ